MCPHVSSVTALVRLVRQVGRWIVIGALVGVAAGVSSALFLTMLARVTQERASRPWLLALLPAAGFVIGLTYRYIGGRSARGTDLVLDAVGARGTGATVGASVPRRLAPLVLLGTLTTHLFGGSAGREGTAIQMSGSIGDALARLLRLDHAQRRVLLVASIAGGFASVFGVPLAGTVFALEVQSLGRLRRTAFVPALVASFVGARVVHLLDWPHDVTPRIRLDHVPVDPVLLLQVTLAATAFGLTAVLFSTALRRVRSAAAHLRWSPLRPLVGGTIIVALTIVVGTDDYLGLSLPLVADAYGGDVFLAAFALKLGFTAITLGSGFPGGEVTPLFVIGATLGATVASLLGAPPGLLAAIGFVALFAGATKTPLASTIMGIELFGGGAVPYLLLGCLVATVVSGETGIYAAQQRTPLLRKLGDRRSR